MSIPDNEARMKVLSVSNAALRSTGPSYQEVTDLVLADSPTGFQDQYVQSLMRDEMDFLEDEFCPLNSSPNSLVEEQRSESIQINVTEDRQNLASSLSRDKNLNNQETVEGISGLERVGSSEFPEERPLSVKSNDISVERKESKKIGSKNKSGQLESRLMEKVKPGAIIKRKAKDSANLEMFANSFEEPGEMKMIKKDNRNEKCNLCEKMFGQNDWGKFIRHKKLVHNVSCSDCELMFVDEGDLNKHSRKFHRIATKHDCEVKYDYECRKCLKKSRTSENIAKHERLKHPFQCQVCVEEKVDYPFSFIDKNGLKHHTEAMHNVETTTKKYLGNSALEGDSNEDFDNSVLEGDSNKNNDDLKVVAIVPKIIKGTTSFIIDEHFGTIKKKPCISIKKEPEIVKLNENCSSLENIAQDDVCNREIGCSRSLGVNYSTRIKNETLEEENNLGKVQSNVRMATNNNIQYMKNEFLVNDESWKINTSNDEVTPFTSEVRQQYQGPLTVAGGAVVVNSGTNRKVNYWSPLDPMSPTSLIPSTLSDQATVLPLGTPPLPQERTFPILGSHWNAAAKSGMETPNPSSMGSGGTTPSMGSISIDARRGLHPVVAHEHFGRTEDEGNVKVVGGVGGDASGIRMTRPPTTRVMGGLRMPGATGVRLTRGATGVARAPGVSFTWGAPAVPFTRGAQGVPFTRRAPGVPFTRGAPGVPFTRGARGVPFTSGAPAVHFTMGMRTRMPMMRIEEASRPILVGQMRSRGSRTRGGSRVGLRTRGGSGEPLVRGNRPTIPMSSGVSGIRSVRLLTDRGGLRCPQSEGPRRPVIPGISTAHLHHTKKTKNVEVEVIELSDDESSPAALTNPALERLRNSGISVTPLKSSTKPECLKVPPGISLSPVGMSCSNNEPRNKESREKASNASNNNRPAQEQATYQSTFCDSSTAR